VPQREDTPTGAPGDAATPAGSPASWGRRLAAIAVDWLACVLIAAALTDRPATQLAALGVFALENVLLLTTLGATFGMRLLGIRVAQLDRPGQRPVPPVRALVRTVLLCLVIPAFVWDRDGRGLHDKAAGTVVVRS
jgi:uncharacterized RDD family membrane protein YckC